MKEVRPIKGCTSLIVYMTNAYLNITRFVVSSL